MSRLDVSRYKNVLLEAITSALYTESPVQVARSWELVQTSLIINECVVYIYIAAKHYKQIKKNIAFLVMHQVSQ